MSRPEYLNLRITEHRTRWLDALLKRLELEPTSGNYTIAIDYALMRAVDEENTMETTDRVRQVDWLRELASNIADWATDDITAKELLEYARSEDGTEYWEITWPSWFDEHDERLLTEQIAANIS